MWCSILIQSGTPACRTGPPTLRVDLPTLMNLIRSFPRDMPRGLSSGDSRSCQINHHCGQAVFLLCGKSFLLLFNNWLTLIPKNKLQRGRGIVPTLTSCRTHCLKVPEYTAFCLLPSPWALCFNLDFSLCLVSAF